MNEKETKLSIGEVFGIFREGLVWIIIITILFACIGGAYAFLVQKTSYTAKIDAYIFTDKLYTESDDGKRNEDISEHIAYQYCSMLVPQCEAVFTSNEIMNEVSKQGIVLNGTLDFIVQEDSPFFSITYTYSEHGGNPDEIKSKVAKTLNDYVQKSIHLINADKDKYIYLSDKIVVYSDAAPKDVDSSTGRAKVIILATLIGLVVSMAVVLIKRLFSDTLTSKDQVEQITNGQIIATIDISPNMVENRDKQEKGVK